jgi:hypothetical protein
MRCIPEAMLAMFLPVLTQSLLSEPQDKDLLSDVCWTLSHLTEHMHKQQIQHFLQSRTIPVRLEQLSVSVHESS